MVVEILVGNIASGKSAYAKKRAREGAIIINDDAIVSELHGGLYELYNEDYKIIYKTIEMNILMVCIAHGLDVVIDRGTNITAKSRRRFVSYCNGLDIPCDAIVFPLDEPKVHAQRRMDDNGRGYDFKYWEKVATRMLRDHEYPQMTEGFRDVIRYHDIKHDFKFKAGDRVIITKEYSTKYNPHIRHTVGEKAFVDGVYSDCCQIDTDSGGHGLVDNDILEKI